MRPMDAHEPGESHWLSLGFSQWKQNALPLRAQGADRATLLAPGALRGFRSTARASLPHVHRLARVERQMQNDHVSIAYGTGFDPMPSLRHGSCGSSSAPTMRASCNAGERRGFMTIAPRRYVDREDADGFIAGSPRRCVQASRGQDVSPRDQPHPVQERAPPSPVHPDCALDRLRASSRARASTS